MFISLACLITVYLFEAHVELLLVVEFAIGFCQFSLASPMHNGPYLVYCNKN